MTKPDNQPSSRRDRALEFRMVTHATSSISQDVGDVDNHTLSLSRFSGLAFFSDGTIATVYFQSLSDYINGAGTFTLYPVISFDDGSSLFIKSTGTGTVDGSKTKFVGTLTVLGGKGQFENADGDGKLTGVRLYAASSRRRSCQRLQY
jgi:hypothetical protein